METNLPGTVELEVGLGFILVETILMLVGLYSVGAILLGLGFLAIVVGTVKTVSSS